MAIIGISARPYSVRVGELKGDPAQLRVHRRMRELLAGGGRWDSAAQAPVSLRVIPQVHGAALDLIARLREQLERELRAVADSPVFLPASEGEPEGLYPTGNFHAQAVTTLLDAVGVALAQVLNLVEKRMHRVLDSRFSRLPEQLSLDPGRQSGLVILHKQVIGLAAEAASLAAPGSIRAGGRIDRAGGLPGAHDPCRSPARTDPGRSRARARLRARHPAPGARPRRTRAAAAAAGRARRGRRGRAPDPRGSFAGPRCRSACAS